jgi:VIT1/CCC1 family predicted Fe2+/Mn2+ transporter
MKMEEDKRDKMLNEVEQELEEEIQELEGQIVEEKKAKEMLHESEHKLEPKKGITTAKPVLHTPDVAERMVKSNSIFDILLPILAVLLIIAISFFLYGLIR